MSNAEIEELFHDAGRLHFDGKPCAGYSIENDLDDEIWTRFAGRAKIPEAMEPVVALRNLGLLDGEDRMTFAGAWLTARDVRRFTVSAHVSCALFLGVEKVRILDRRDFHRDVPAMIDDAVAWILTKINVEFVIRGMRREERPELPEEALREAVANAVAHRDYRSTANVQIYVFRDRIEIVSPGGLPAGMTEADLGTKSMPRNPLLFGMLYRMDVVENIGSGIRRIRHLCREHGVAEPIIDTSGQWVTVTFPRPAGRRSLQRGVRDAGRQPESRPEQGQESSGDGLESGGKLPAIFASAPAISRSRSSSGARSPGWSPGPSGSFSLVSAMPPPPAGSSRSGCTARPSDCFPPCHPGLLRVRFLPVGRVVRALFTAVVAGRMSSPTVPRRLPGSRCPAESSAA